MAHTLDDTLIRSILLLALFVAFLVAGCGGKAVDQRVAPSPPPRTTYLPGEEELEDRRKEWPLLLDDQDKFAAARAGIRGLRKTKLKDGQLEVRIWVGYAPWITRVLILREKGGMFLPPVEGPTNDSPVERPRPVTPREGWPQFWEGIKGSGLLELPDDSAVGVVEPALDSTSVIVEVKRGNDYRHFGYHYPCQSDTEEAKKLLDILAFIAESTDVDLYRCDGQFG